MAVQSSQKPYRFAFVSMLCLCVSANVMALGADEQGGLVDTLIRHLGFAPDANTYDLSLMYLGQMFGSVGAALLGPDNQMISAMFRLFNIGVLSIAGTMIGYATAMSVVHTAGQGVALGKKWDAALPLVTRQVAAVSLLLPQFNGYSALQVLIMVLVVRCQPGQLYGAGSVNTQTSMARIVHAVINCIQQNSCIHAQ